MKKYKGFTFQVFSPFINQIPKTKPNGYENENKKRPNTDSNPSLGIVSLYSNLKTLFTKCEEW